MTYDYTRYGAPKAVQDLASGQRNAKNVIGARAAVGSIVFAGNLSAGDVITANGTAFTAVASGATGNQFNLGASLSDTLDNIVTKLNASAVAAVALATYAKGGSNDTLTVTLDAKGSAGNDFTLTCEDDEGADVGTTTEPAGGTDADTLDVSKDSIFFITTSAGGDQTLTLGEGARVGQEIRLYMLSRGGSSNAVVSGTFVGGTTATFNAAHDFVDLMWTGDAWTPILNTSVVIA